MRYSILCVTLYFLIHPQNSHSFSVSDSKKSSHVKNHHLKALPTFVGTAITLLTNLSNSNAIDIGAGKQIFEQSCASCHAGGNNAIAKQRTLKMDALNEYLLNPTSGSDIARFIKDSTLHRGALAFSAKLNDDAYENVGHYVFIQAKENKWTE